MTSFEDLDIWRRRCNLSVDFCEAFRKCTDYGFKVQNTRSTISFPSNIAKSAKLLSQKEFGKFLGYAKGIAGDLRTQFIIAGRVGYIDESQSKAWISEIRQNSAVIYRLAKSLEQ